MFYILLIAGLLCSHRSAYGIPIEGTMSLSSYISQLAENCTKNYFLTVNAEKYQKDCNVTALGYSRQSLLCLTFYDMNYQMCEAIKKNTSISFDERSYTRFKEANISLDDVCQPPVSFQNLAPFPKYKSSIETVFSSPGKCSILCDETSDNVLIPAVNSYCKFVRWSTTELASFVKGKNSLMSESFTKPNKDQVQKQVISLESSTTLNSNKQVVLNDQSKKKQQESISQVSTQTEQSPGKDNTKASQVRNENKEGGSKTVAHFPDQTIKDESKVTLKNENNKSNQNIDLVGENDAQNNQGETDSKLKQAIVTVPSALNQDQDKEAEKESVADNPLDDSFLDGEQQSLTFGEEFSKELKPQSDKDISLQKPYVKEEAKESNQQPKKPAPYDFAVVPDEDEDSEDSFFPFFLTSIGLVALLYILYHNKNKITKVVLGLLVEGRQGRRRTSRGHAYKRLDTLEQAMSTSSSSAPPSKIIY